MTIALITIAFAALVFVGAWIDHRGDLGDLLALLPLTLVAVAGFVALAVRRWRRS